MMKSILFPVLTVHSKHQQALKLLAIKLNMFCFHNIAYAPFQSYRMLRAVNKVFSFHLKWPQQI